MGGHGAREVLVPVVTGQDGALARIRADGEDPLPHPARLDPAISELIEHGLYQAGQQAVAALRRTPQRRGGWLPAPRGTLSLSNPGDVIGLADANSASSELGLALALAAFRAQGAGRGLIATGALAPGEGGAVPVRPVHHLGAKLALVARHFRQPGAAPPPPICLVPETDSDGCPVAEACAPEVRELADLGIVVTPVATLEAALAVAGLRRAAPHPADRRLRGWAAAAMSGLALGAALFWAVSRPVSAVFLPAALDDGSLRATPFAASLVEGRLEPRQDCLVDGMPLMRNGEVVALRMETRAGAGALGVLDRWLGVHAVVVGVGSESGVKVLPLPASAGPREDPVQSVLVPVTGPAEDNLLVVLFRRARPFDRDRLEADLRQRLDGLGSHERIAAAANNLETRAPGLLVYRFRNAAEEAGPCR